MLTYYMYRYIIELIKKRKEDATLKRFEIWSVDFGKDVIGSEQGGVRPAVIIQNDTGNVHSDTTIVLPLTTKIKKIYQPTHTLIRKDVNNGLEDNSMVLGECIRQVSKKRVRKYIGFISSDNDKSAIKNVYLANFGE